MPRALAAKNLDQLFELEPHLMNELLALIEVHLRIVAGEAVACAADRKTLFIQQAANLTNDEHILPLIVPAVAPLVGPLLDLLSGQLNRFNHPTTGISAKLDFITLGGPGFRAGC